MAKKNPAIAPAESKKVEELMNVRGIGEVSFLKLKALVAITAPRADRAAAQ